MSGPTRVFGALLPASWAVIGLLLVSAWSGGPCFAEGWSFAAYDLEIVTHFTQVAQQQEGSVVLTIEHTQGVTLNVTATAAGTEVFSCQAPGSTDTLLSKYKLTGADLSAPDATWVSSSDFINPARSYLVPHTDGISQITLEAQCTAADNRAQDAGSYTASLSITASW